MYGLHVYGLLAYGLQASKVLSGSSLCGAGDQRSSDGGQAKAIPPACAQQQSPQDADQLWLAYHLYLQ